VPRPRKPASLKETERPEDINSLVFSNEVDGFGFTKGEVRTISLPYSGVKSLTDSEKL